MRGGPAAAMRVYPRAGGGTGYSANKAYDGEGLSPRRRGNLADNPETSELMGSIPAQAGEPRRLAVLARLPPRVYPRAGGGTPSSSTSSDPALRVYPRAGGGTDSPGRRIPAPYATSGSIPAQAGEPALSEGSDYIYDPGLSPRRRGNPCPDGSAPAHALGSIPAQAGEPSPPSRDTDVRSTIGSIPAQAGEPMRAVRGGLDCAGSIPAQAGEPISSHLELLPCDLGSIPAQAGEPMARPDLIRHQHVGVYPRAGGGTH